MNRKLWYTKQAFDWNEALPIGNGRLGAMAFSGAISDKFRINEDTLWTGCPDKANLTHDMGELDEIRSLIKQEKYHEATQKTSDMMFGVTSEAYVVYGSLFVDVLCNSTEVSDYRRELDLETATLKSEYLLGDTRVQKEAFVSLCDDVIAIGIRCDKPLDFSVYQSIDLKHEVRLENDVITAIGSCPTGVDEYDEGKESIRFCSRVCVNTDGQKIYDNGAFTVKSATEIIILFSISTSFNGYDKMPISEGKEYINASLEALENAKKHDFDKLKARHSEKYKAFFDRVDLQIDGEDFSHLPTDERIKNMGEGTADNYLVCLLFDFSRYLAISASMPSSQPMNLQGIWNDSMTPPWNSNYTMNINTEMNYWAVETQNLPEMHMPYMKMIKELAERGNTFGLRGWASWHNSDIWRFRHEATKGVLWGFWIMGGFWSVRHIWEHYIHTNDVDFLKEYYPVMIGAAEFSEDWMIENEKGELITSPSTSPENRFLDDNGKLCAVCEGSAMDMSIICDLFDKTIKAGNILGEDTEHLQSIKNRLAPVKIGSDGRILEWGKELQESELGHRHISHLYGIYPSDIWQDEKHIEAAKKTLEVRLLNGGGHTGWSNAWIAAVYARLCDKEGVMRHIRNMFKKSMYPNMLDAHPPFQIDGNFGIAAAICEALMQSHTGEVVLIPALPEEWKSGHAFGFVTRQGKKIDFEWCDGKAKITRTE